MEGSMFILTLCCLVGVSMAIPCHKKCETGLIRGVCNTGTGLCRCPYGWIGPQSKYAYGSANRIDAKYCDRACFYNMHYHNPLCKLLLTQGAPGGGNTGFTCDQRCEHASLNYGAQCVAQNRCLCHYGFTGPNAIYIRSTTHEYHGRIVADYCSVPCHYEPNHLSNPDCAGEP